VAKTITTGAEAGETERQIAEFLTYQPRERPRRKSGDGGKAIEKGFGRRTK
jgi:hypothetical protein